MKDFQLACFLSLKINPVAVLGIRISYEQNPAINYTGKPRIRGAKRRKIRRAKKQTQKVQFCFDV
jgi:hypothetical protein